MKSFEMLNYGIGETNDNNENLNSNFKVPPRHPHGRHRPSPSDQKACEVAVSYEPSNFLTFD
jgi:hypothetical protein